MGGVVPEDRLERSDRMVLLLWILLGLAGAGVAYKYFFRAFPEAAVDFKVSRPGALERARGFLVGRQHDLSGYRSGILFTVDENAKTYLEREVGLEQANRLMASEVSVWYWRVRFFRPGQKEEFRVDLSPTGRVVGFDHIVEEAREGARLDRDAARSKAERFARENYGSKFAEYDDLPEEANSTERPRRRDWSFTWERRGFRAPPRETGAPYRLRIDLHGAEVAASEEFLKVPEAWQRDYARLRSSNDVFQYLGEVPFYFLLGAIVWMIFDVARRGRVHWGSGATLGAVVAALFFANSLNEWPLWGVSYDTNVSYSGFIVQRVSLAALGSLAAGLFVAAAFLAGEPLYRRNQPRQLRLRVAARLPGIRTKEFFCASVIGLGMAAASIGFVVVFYLVSGHFGAWAPQEIKYTDVASTGMPWLYPLAIALFAATSEEFVFRLFAVPFLLRVTGSKLVAVVLPALIWGFLHSAYPQEPGYIRGVEVGTIGIVAGLVMLRWGILATVIWHYTLDALLIGLFLLRSESLYFRASGAIVSAAVLIPLAVSGVFYLRRRRFEADESLWNRAELDLEAPRARVAEVAPGTAVGSYEGLSRRTRGLVAGLGLAGALLVVAVKSETIGDYVRFSLDRRQAVRKASEILRRRGVNPGGYRTAATILPTFDGYANEYLRRQVGIAGANRFYREKVPSAFWSVRYFQDSQKEEYTVLVCSDGTVHSVDHEMEEKTPGANLTKEQAQARAETYLREEKRLDLGRWKLVEAQSDKHPARTDHAFTWEEREGIGEAHVRMEVKVKGDEVSGYRVFVKIPEEWVREQSRKTLAWIVHQVGRVVLLVSFSILVLVVFFRNLKQPAAAAIPWKRLSGWALWALFGTVVASANSLPKVLSVYPTNIPLKTFLFELLVGLFLFAGLAYAGLVFLFGLGWFFLSRAFGAERLPSWRGMPAGYYLDALYIGLGGAAALVGLARLNSLLSRIWPTAKRSLDALLPSSLDAYLPASQVLAGVLSSGLFWTGLIALVGGFIVGYVQKRWQQVTLFTLVVLTMTSNWGSPADFAKQVLMQLVILGLAVWGAVRIVRFNALAYFLLAAVLVISGEAARLLEQPNGFFRANGFALLAMGVVLVVWPLAAWRGPRAAHRSSPS